MIVYLILNIFYAYFQINQQHEVIVNLYYSDGRTYENFKNVQKKPFSIEYLCFQRP